jgi:WD40 repeat protein
VTAPNAAAARDAVFVSYSHDDQEWQRKFTLMLAPDVRNHRLTLWDDDTYIKAGDDWRRNIDGSVNAVAFSPDGWRLASAAYGVVRLWDPASGAEQAPLTGHDNVVTAVAFSPDGRWLASAGREGIVWLWDGKPAGALSLLRLGAPIEALAWGGDAIALGKRASVVLFNVVTHE